MAKIDLYNARGLAKQAVGTPGVDTTGEEITQLGSSITKATNQYIAAETEKLRIANNIQGEVEKLKFENELYNKFEQDKQNVDNINNPYGLADSSYSTAETMAQDYAKGISNPYVREVFQQKASLIPGQAQKQMTQWAGKQTTTNALVSVKEGMDGIISQASKMQDLNGYMGSLAQGEALITNAMPVIGVDNAYQLRQQLRKGAAESFLYPKMDNSPGTVKAYIESGKFDDIFDGKDKAQLLHTCDTIEKRNVKQQQSASRASSLASGQAVMAKLHGGQATLSDVNSYIYELQQQGVTNNSKSMKNAIAMRKALIENGNVGYAATNRAQATDMLDNRFSILSNKESKTKVTWDELDDLQDMLYTNGTLLTQATYRSYQNKINEAATDLVKRNPYAKAATKALSYSENPKTGQFDNQKPKSQNLKMGNTIRDEAVRTGYQYIESELKKRGANKEQLNTAKGRFRTIFDQSYEGAYEKSMRQRGVWDIVTYRDWAARQTIKYLGY